MYMADGSVMDSRNAAHIDSLVTYYLTNFVLEQVQTLLKALRKMYYQTFH